MLLHILNRPPGAGPACRQALDAMGPDDRLLLIEDGVQGALPGWVSHFDGIPGRLYALGEDLDSRGLAQRRGAGVRVVDIEGFVTLTEEARGTVSWY